MTYDRMIIPKDSAPIKLHEEPDQASNEWTKSVYGKIAEHAKNTRDQQVADVNRAFTGLAKALSTADEPTQMMWSKVVSALPDWARRGANLPNRPGYWRLKSRPSLVLWVDEGGLAWHGDSAWDNDGSHDAGDGDWEQLAPIPSREQLEDHYEEWTTQNARIDAIEALLKKSVR